MKLSREELEEGIEFYRNYPHAERDLEHAQKIIATCKMALAAHDMADALESIGKPIHYTVFWYQKVARQALAEWEKI